ncbi:MAG TPA: tRNA uridine-5-carboxymethylaminomethyl(34) synthesis enzyme MnmG [Gemmatimonadales bacterium]|nr:tRNA uridine-5-carboxymethylaminomethyl(34) synthesis enzyme MnmG [Gemmatimonadales bacterium]
MLNRSKGPAVWSPRAQCDRGLYRRAVRSILERQARLECVQGTVAELLVQADTCGGVVTVDGRRYDSAATVITAGTFLRGRIHLGTSTRIDAGRAGEAPSVEMAEALRGLGFEVQRFKTGTPPRIDGRTVDFGALQRQDGDKTPYWFSVYEWPEHPAQLPCWLTWSGPELKEIIQRHLSESALYGGEISGRGPRYCPSVEDKIVKFPDAERHQIFLEPEGLDTSEMYVNGLSTSLPPAVQLEFLRTVPGLGAVHMTRPGYAIEYDYFPPHQLHPTLETRLLPGLFLAGQVNGTTGYEEAAGQGAVAGLNAAASALGREPAVLGRDQAFMGVLVDDLVSRGVDEPYRLFTSRSEYRLLLRQDNALRRLLPIALEFGLLDEDERRIAEGRLEREDRILAVSRETDVEAGDSEAILRDAGFAAVEGRMSVAELARRPGVPLGRLLEAAAVPHDPAEAEWADIELKYAGYLHRERTAAERLRGMDAFTLPDLPYAELRSLSFEARQKLAHTRPATLGQAGRIPGVSPSDLQGLVFETLKRRKG